MADRGILGILEPPLILDESGYGGAKQDFLGENGGF